MQNRWTPPGNFSWNPWPPPLGILAKTSRTPSPGFSTRVHLWIRIFLVCFLVNFVLNVANGMCKKMLPVHHTDYKFHIFNDQFIPSLLSKFVSWHFFFPSLTKIFQRFFSSSLEVKHDKIVLTRITIKRRRWD
jgi:hypothetical protein